MPDDATRVLVATSTDWHLVTAEVEGVTVDDDVELADAQGGPRSLDSPNETVGGLALPRWLAVDNAATVYLISQARPDRLLSLTNGSLTFNDRTPSGDSPPFGQLEAVAVNGRRVFVADVGDSKLYVLDRLTWTVETIVTREKGWLPVDVAAFAQHVWVLDAAGTVHRYKTDSWKQNSVLASPPGWTYRRLIVDDAGRLHALRIPHANMAGLHTLDRLVDDSGQYRTEASFETAGSVRQSFRQASLAVDHEGNFRSAGSAGGQWYDKNGNTAELAIDRWAGPNAYGPVGKWISAPIDSEIYECRWHRLRLDADVPVGTRLTVSALSTAENVPAPTAVREFRSDWIQLLDLAGNRDTVPRLDALVRSPPGRYLHLLFELQGNGHSSPRVRTITLDYPRLTWIKHLPAVYSHDEQSRDFLERFLSLLEQQTEGMAAWIADPGLLFDLDAAPEEMVEFMASWLGIRLEPEWPEAVRQVGIRRIPQAVAQIAGKRGTPAALRDLLRAYLEVLSGVDLAEVGVPEVVEAFRDRPRPTLRGEVLGSNTMLTTRATCGLSCQGEALGSVFAENAHRFAVYVPATLVPDAVSERIVRRAIDGERPAHTSYDLFLTEPGVSVGSGARVGLNTLIGDVPVTVLARCEEHDGAPSRSAPRLGVDTVLGARHAEPAALSPGMYVGERVE